MLLFKIIMFHNFTVFTLDSNVAVLCKNKYGDLLTTGLSVLSNNKNQTDTIDILL